MQNTRSRPALAIPRHPAVAALAAVAAVAAVAALVPVAGCFSTRAVDPDQLAPLARARSGGARFVHTDSQWRAELDPNTQIRFRNADGYNTAWMNAGDLLASERGVYRRGRVRAAYIARRAVISGLGPAERELLARTATARFVRHPAAGARGVAIAHGTIESRPDGAVAIDAGEPLARWLRRFLVAVGERAGGWQGRGDTLAHARAHADSWPLGTWRLELGDGRVLTLTGRQLVDALRGGVEVPVGWRWDDITGAEVVNFSGGKTLGAIAGYTAAAAVVIPVALVAGGLSAAPRGGGGGYSNGKVRRAGESLDGVLDAVGRIDTPADGAPDLAERGAFAPLAGIPTSADAAAIFDARTRRRATVRFVVNADGATDASALDQNGVHLIDGASVGVRLWNTFELAGGARHVLTRRNGGVRDSDTLGFARLGAHLGLDAPRRFAIPLAIELGAGPRVDAYFKLQLGLRVQIDDVWFVGASVLNPTYVGFASDAPSANLRGWAFTSGLEVGAAL